MAKMYKSATNNRRVSLGSTDFVPIFFLSVDLLSSTWLQTFEVLSLKCHCHCPTSWIIAMLLGCCVAIRSTNLKGIRYTSLPFQKYCFLLIIVLGKEKNNGVFSESLPIVISV